jgi:hypothetical protein
MGQSRDNIVNNPEWAPSELAPKHLISIALHKCRTLSPKRLVRRVAPRKVIVIVSSGLNRLGIGVDPATLGCLLANVGFCGPTRHTESWIDLSPN